MEYDGWTNRETWIVYVWLSDTAHWHEIALVETQEAAHIGDLCDVLEKFIKTLVDDVQDELTGDLVNNSLVAVNWAEIARFYAKRYNQKLLK